jgi:hypothetical protein
MQQLNIEKNWWIAFIFFPLFIGCALFVIWALTWPGIAALRANGSLPADWSWAGTIAFDLFFIGLIGALCWTALAQLLTVFTEAGIQRPGLSGRISIPWSDILSVGADTGMRLNSIIEIRTINRSLKIHKYYYKDHKQLISLLQERVPASAQWQL